MIESKRTTEEVADLTEKACEYVLEKAESHRSKKRSTRSWSIGLSRTEMLELIWVAATKYGLRWQHIDNVMNGKLNKK
jgi:hypothetical protein